MTHHQIKCFCALVKFNNFTRAAESMYLSQPAFSRVIAALEKELGCELFVRDKVNPRLTAKGKEILPHMLAMQEHYQKACHIASASEDKDKYEGTIVFGVFRFGLLNFLPHITSEYRKIHPGCYFDMIEHTGVSVFPALKGHEVDLTHTNYIPVAYQKHLEVFEVGRFTYRALLPINHPLVERDNLRIEDLAEERFVAVDRQQFPLMHSRLIMACANAGFAPNIVREFDTMTNLFDYISEGRAVSIMAINNPHHPRVKAVPLKEIQQDPTVITWAKDNTKPELLDFIEFIKQVKAEMDEKGLSLEDNFGLSMA